MSVCGRLLPPSNTTAALAVWCLKSFIEWCFVSWPSSWGVASLLFSSSLVTPCVLVHYWLALSELSVKNFVNLKFQFREPMCRALFPKIRHSNYVGLDCEESGKRLKCKTCKNNKTPEVCNACKLPVCGPCSISVCNSWCCKWCSNYAYAFATPFFPFRIFNARIFN